MKLKAAFKFEIRDFLTTVFSVYGVMMLINIIAIVVQLASKNNFKTNMTLNGAEIILIVTVFIIAAGDFRENFQMLMQNGVSRKTIFISKAGTGLMFALILSIADRLFIFLSKIISDLVGVTKSTESVWIQIYPEFADKHNAVWSFIAFAAVGAAVYICSYMLGTVLSGLIYRLGKGGRTALAIALPVTAFVLVPLLLEIFWETAFVRWLIHTLVTILGLGKGIPYPAAATFTVLSCILGAASWLIIRRAVPKD